MHPIMPHVETEVIRSRNPVWEWESSKTPILNA